MSKSLNFFFSDLKIPKLRIVITMESINFFGQFLNVLNSIKVLLLIILIFLRSRFVFMAPKTLLMF